MSRWRRVVRRELARYCEETGWRVVELQELYDQMLPVLRREFPDNANRRAKLRQILQQLGEQDELAFVDGAGRYEILDLDGESSGGRDDADIDDADADNPDARDWQYEVSEYQTVTGTRSMPAGFRSAALARYDHQCPVSGVDSPALLDVAHVLPWSEFESIRGDLQNVLALDKTHHAAFDEGLYTLDGDFRLRVSPEFETDSDLLRRTLLSRNGERVGVPDGAVNPAYLRQHNQALEWW